MFKIGELHLNKAITNASELSKNKLFQKRKILVRNKCTFFVIGLFFTKKPWSLCRLLKINHDRREFFTLALKFFKLYDKSIILGKLLSFS